MKNQSRLWSGTAAAFLLLSLMLSGCGTAVAEPNPAPVSAQVVSTPPTTVEAVASPAPDKPGAEGIKVHGQWTIEVTNPDGTVAERREFQNSLSTGTDSGATFLARVLARQATIDHWGIHLMTIGLSSDWYPFESNGTPTMPGVIAESNYAPSGSYIFKTLTVTVPTSGNNANKLVFSGTATASRTGKITQVRTVLLPPSTAWTGPFSYTTLPTVLDVSAGQQINVTVVISFS